MTAVNEKIRTELREQGMLLEAKGNPDGTKGEARMRKTRNSNRLGIAELERRLGCSRQTVWRWCRAGTFPNPHYIGERRFWFVQDVEAWEAAQMARGPEARQNARNLVSAGDETVDRRSTEAPKEPGPVVEAEEDPDTLWRDLARELVYHCREQDERLARIEAEIKAIRERLKP